MKNTVKYICLVAIFTALMCVIAPLSIPMVPVPITLATLMVYIISGLFDFKIAPLIIILYVLIGMMGVPVFASYTSGIGVIMGPTGGFILGYILAAIFMSVIITFFKDKKWIFPVAMVGGTVIIYLFGFCWFLILTAGKYTVAQALMLCVVPFLIGDSIKIVLSSLICLRLRKFVDNQLAKAR